jgi:hypothetical protein
MSKRNEITIDVLNTDKNNNDKINLKTNTYNNSNIISQNSNENKKEDKINIDLNNIKISTKLADLTEDEKQNFLENKKILDITNKKNIENLNKNSTGTDLMKVQEFLPENIQAQFEGVKSKDFFAFTDENDKKYDFYKAKYLMRSKTMVKAFYWSTGIGVFVFFHRYHRKQNLKRSIYIGTASMALSFILLWGNFEINPFMTSFYFSKHIENMAKQDLHKSTYYNYLKYQSDNISKLNKKGYKFTISMEPCDEIAKYYLELDNQILLNMNSNKFIDIDSIIKKIENYNDEDEENENETGFSSGKDIYKKTHYYDYNEFNKESNSDCKIDIQKFFEIEEKDGGPNLVKLNILKNDKISRDKKETLDLLRYHLKISDKYLRGEFKDLKNDPDYIYNDHL